LPDHDAERGGEGGRERKGIEKERDGDGERGRKTGRERESMTLKK